MRLVDFEEAYDYSKGTLKICQFLSYWKSIANIFDLEFFVNKLSSSAQSMSNVEKMVLSGVPFYEEGDDTLFADGPIEEEEEEAAPEVTPRNDFNPKSGRKRKQKEEDRFDEGGHRPLKNVLASKVSEKIADEKREKMQLVQDLEGIKDLFVEYSEIMNKQEMASSITRASAFMQEMHHLKFYGVLSILYQMQDSYFKDKKGDKEILFLNDVIMNLSHQNDLKITHNNGFHVNRSLTS